MKLIVIIAGVCALLACTPAWAPPPPDIQRPNDSSFLQDYECWLRTGDLP